MVGCGGWEDWWLEDAWWVVGGEACRRLQGDCKDVLLLLGAAFCYNTHKYHKEIAGGASAASTTKRLQVVLLLLGAACEIAPMD